MSLNYRANIDSKIKALRTPSRGALGRAAQSVKEIGKELAAPPEVPIAAEPTAAPPRTRERQIAPANPLFTNSTANNPVAVKVIEDPGNELVYMRAVAQPFLGPLAEFGIVVIFAVFLLIEE